MGWPDKRLGSANQQSHGSDETKKNTNESESDKEDDDDSDDCAEAEDEEDEQKSAYSDSPNQR